MQGTIFWSTAEDTETRKSRLVSEEHTGQPQFGGKVVFDSGWNLSRLLTFPKRILLPALTASKALYPAHHSWYKIYVQQMLCEELPNSVRSNSHGNLSEWNTQSLRIFRAEIQEIHMQATFQPLMRLLVLTAPFHCATASEEELPEAMWNIWQKGNTKLCGRWAWQCTVSCEEPRRVVLSSPSETIMLLSMWRALTWRTSSMIPFSFPP